MSATLLEQARSAHEEIERLERLIVKDLQQEAKGHKEKLHQSHRVKNFLDTIVGDSARLADIYTDKDGGRREEIAALGGQGGNVFTSFYDRLREIREYHAHHPAARALEPTDDPEELIKEEPYVEFSGEEGLGRYLDLHELFHSFVNAKFGRQIEYSAYLEEFAHTHKITRNFKYTKAYKEYITALVGYLTSFLHRTQPLTDDAALMAKWEGEFSSAWSAGQVAGWEGGGGGAVEGAYRVQIHVDLTEFDTVEELMQPDLVTQEQIKKALAALGMKTGGTPAERAERLLLTKDTPLAALDPKHFVSSGKSGDKKAKQGEVEKEVALLDTKVHRLCVHLQEAVEETKGHVEKKQALTYEEIEAEREEVEAAAAEEDSDDEEGAIYNPLKLPMGWDGKPIPYWLYKLHGLGQEFKCEICGNMSYWGRRAFERHFKEFRHQHGMKCLGIPNTKNFNEITCIKDAEGLWEKIKEKQGTNKWRPEVEEEYEDTEGNVFDRKTFTELQRQGLI